MLLVVGLVAPAPSGATGAYPAALVLSKKIGNRPAASPNEAKAHRYVAGQFRAAGLAVTENGFNVPGRGRSRNVIGMYETPRECLEIYMAHTDSVSRGKGANDNASGVGVLVGLAPRIAKLAPDCDVWLVATGAEEREYTGTSSHLGAGALVGFVRGQGRSGDLRYALSVDMVGRGKRFYLRSPQAGVRSTVEGLVLAAARRAGVTLRWSRDSGEGNSDHREFELAGLPGAVIEVWRGIDPCHHETCDRWPRINKGSMRRVQRIVEALLGS